MRGRTRGASSSSRGRKARERQQSPYERLKGAKFRMLNEMLYSSTGAESFSEFTEDPSLFSTYHEGYEHQLSQWPSDPLDSILSQLRRAVTSHTGRDPLSVADFGCGTARLASELGGPRCRVSSFDLVAANDSVVACNMAHVPLESSSVDVAVFCLSLMGTDFLSFLAEALRVLRPGGALKVAEAKSRMENTARFVRGMAALGFSRTSCDDSNRMFVLMDFVKSPSCPVPPPQDKLNQAKTLLTLKPCLYKRR